MCWQTDHFEFKDIVLCLDRFKLNALINYFREKNMNLKESSAEELKKSLCIPLNAVADLPTFLNKFTTMTAPIM